MGDFFFGGGGDCKWSRIGIYNAYELKLIGKETAGVSEV